MSSSMWISKVLGPIECPECGEQEGLRIMGMERVARSGGDTTRLAPDELAFALADERMDFANGGGIVHLSGECLHDFDIAFSLHKNMLYVGNMALAAATTARCNDLEVGSIAEKPGDCTSGSSPEPAAMSVEPEPTGTAPDGESATPGKAAAVEPESALPMRRSGGETEIEDEGEAANAHDAGKHEAPAVAGAPALGSATAGRPPASSPKKRLQDVSDTERAEIAALYLKKTPVKEIKQLYNLSSYQVLYRILSSQGIERNHPPQPEGKPANAKDSKQGKKAEPASTTAASASAKTATKSTAKTPAKQPEKKKRHRSKKDPSNLSATDLSSLKVSSLQYIPATLVKTLSEAGIETLADLCLYSEEDLANYGIGCGSLAVLTRSLRSIGATLAEAK